MKPVWLTPNQVKKNRKNKENRGSLTLSKVYSELCTSETCCVAPSCAVGTRCSGWFTDLEQRREKILDPLWLAPDPQKKTSGHENFRAHHQCPWKLSMLHQLILIMLMLLLLSWIGRFVYASPRGYPQFGIPNGGSPMGVPNQKTWGHSVLF